MRSVVVLLAMFACNGPATQDPGDTDSRETEVPVELPAALQASESDVLAWFNADDLSGTEVTEWPSSWGTAVLDGSTFEDTGPTTPSAARRVVEGGRSAVRFGRIEEEYLQPFAGTLTDGPALTEGTVAVRFRYREASEGYEYLFSVGTFVGGSPTMVSLARGRDGTEAPEVFYLYDGELLFTSVEPSVATWHTAVVTFSPTATTLHVDGVALPFDRAATTEWSVTPDLYLGAMVTSGNWGNVDVRELWVFSAALDDAARAAVEGHLGR